MVPGFPRRYRGAKSCQRARPSSPSQIWPAVEHRERSLGDSDRARDTRHPERCKSSRQTGCDAQIAGSLDSLSTQRVRGSLGRHFETRCSLHYEAHGFAGTVLIVRHGGIVLLKGYGLADIPSACGMGPRHVFEMNSMAKYVHGCEHSSARGCRQNSARDPIGRYLDLSFPGSKSGATRLCSWPCSRRVSARCRRRRLRGAASRDAFVASMKAAPMGSRQERDIATPMPDTPCWPQSWKFASGQTYEDYLRQHLFQPGGHAIGRILRTEVTPADTLFARGYVGSPSGAVPGPANPYVWVRH